MEKEKQLATLEAILFAMGESVELSKLCEALEEEKSTVKNLLEELRIKYQSPEHGIELIQLEDAYQLTTKKDTYEALVKIAKTPKKMTLSESVIETLSIIAYKQPITRIEIEAIRGVSCDFAVNKLLEYDLICELGRKDAPGRPILFGTTEQFLRTFGVTSIKDLPSINTLQLEEFKQEAEEEIQLSLKI